MPACKLSLTRIGSETIRINNFPNLEAIGPNRIFIHPVSVDKPDEFTLDSASLTSRSSVAFTYRVHVPETDLATHSPLLLKSAWRQQGDKLGLVLEYRLNSAYAAEPTVISNLVLVAMYTGAKASSCQTKPSGTHLKDRSMVYWRLGDVRVTSTWEKVICRFGGLEGTPTPGHVEARWEIHDTVPSGISLSKLEIAAKGKGRAGDEDPFADTGDKTDDAKWIDLAMTRKLVSGKYEAYP